jgi:hypothetical protein
MFYKEFIRYFRGRFTTNQKIIFDLKVIANRFKFLDKSWVRFLTESLKNEEIKDFQVVSNILKNQIIVKFISESEMINSKNATVQRVKKAISKTNKLIQEKILDEHKSRFQLKIKSENIQKLNANFENTEIQFNFDDMREKVLHNPIIEVQSSNKESRYFVRLDQLKMHLINHPFHKIIDVKFDINVVNLLLENLNVNSLDPFLNTEVGFSQPNTIYLENFFISDANNSIDNKPVQYSIKHNQEINRYYIIDPDGNELAASFLSLTKAKDFIRKLKFVDGKTEIEIDL